MTRHTMHALLLLALTVGVLHGETVYIDPDSTASGQSDGSRQRPFTSWQQVKFQAGNEYLQKAGTVAVSTGEIRPTGKVMLGTYGAAAGQEGYAKIESRVEGDQAAIAGWRTHDVTIQNLDISAPRGVSVLKFNGANRITVRNCRLHDSHWGIRLYGGGEGHRILNTEVFNIRDDGMFLQGLHDLEIGHCRVWNVNQNWKPPYTSQKEAGGDAIQLSRCDRWHVHHNVLDRTNSGNKFCFISNENQTQGIFEHNRLTGPLTTGDGGASIYFGTGGANIIVRYNTILGPSPGAIYHHTANLQVYGNTVADMSSGFSNHGPAPTSVIRRNLLLDVAEPFKGSRYEASENLVLRRARDDRRTIHLSFQSLQVMREDPNTILDDSFSGTLAVRSEGLQTSQTDADQPPPDIKLEGSLQVQNGRIVGGRVVVVRGTSQLFRCDVSAGFVLPGFVAAFAGSCPRLATDLAPGLRAPWSEGGQPTALLRFDPASNSASLVVSASLQLLEEKGKRP